MGYAHSWSHDTEIPAATWTQITGDARRLAADFRPALSELQIDDDCIIFNGAPPKDFETFGLSRLPQDVWCKTNHRPYDKLVCAVLSVAKQHYPALEVGSDALFEGLGVIISSERNSVISGPRKKIRSPATSAGQLRR